MALSLRHWVLATALGCAVIAAAYLPPQHGPSRFWQPSRSFETSAERARFAALDAVVGRTRRQLALLERRDAALRRAGATRPGTGTLLLDAGLEPAAATRLRAAFAAVWREVSSTRPEVAVITTLVSDSATARILSTDRIYYFLPSARNAHMCLTVSAGVTWVRWLRRSFGTGTAEYTSARRLIGPCAFYAAFGIPGPAIERWLTARDFDLGFDNDWQVQPDLSPATPTFPRRWIRQQLYGGSFAQVSCLAGRRADCRAALFDTIPPEDVPPRHAARGRLPQVVEQQYWGYDWAGTWIFRGATYLVDLVRDQGPERFGRFWRSPLPVDSAFHSAFGVSIEEWTALRQAQHVPQFRVGGGVQLVSGLLALLAAGAVLAGGVALAARRRVG